MNERPPRLFIFTTLLIALVLQQLELPYALSLIRPLWLPLVLSYWVMVIPQPGGLLTAFLFGLMMDVLNGCVLGQHALALTLTVFVVIQIRGVLSLYPVWQEAAALLPVWLVYTVTLFWIDGATAHRADPWLRWVPVLTTGLVWPLVFTLLNGLRHRASRDPSQL